MARARAGTYRLNHSRKRVFFYFFVRAHAKNVFRLIAVVTENLKTGRISVSYDPTAKRIPAAADFLLFSMFCPAAVDVVNRKKNHLLFTATFALKFVVGVVRVYLHLASVRVKLGPRLRLYGLFFSHTLHAVIHALFTVVTMAVTAGIVLRVLVWVVIGQRLVLFAGIAFFHDTPSVASVGIL